MKLIALISILGTEGRTAPGSPIEVSDEEGVLLKGREFARDPSDAELAEHWPTAEDDAKAKAKAEADAKAAAKAEAKAKADAEAAAKAEAKAKAEADAAAKSGNG